MDSIADPSGFPKTFVRVPFEIDVAFLTAAAHGALVRVVMGVRAERKTY